MQKKKKLHKSTAFHEAGHAIAANKKGVRINFIDIEPTYERFGETDLNRYDINIKNDMDRAFILMAGPVAERKLDPDVYGDIKKDSDCQSAWMHVQYSTGMDQNKIPDLPEEERLSLEKRCKELFRCLEKSLEKFFNDSLVWSTVSNLAEVLLVRGRIEGCEAENVIREALGKK